MSTINATNIVADALVGNASANAITVRGEGSATTSLQQGLSKVWCNFVADSPSINDSLNTSSVTDGGNCDYTYNFSSNMGNDDYCPTGYVKDGGNDLFVRNCASTDADTMSASAFQVSPAATNASTFTTAFDPNLVCITITGDLA